MILLTRFLSNPIDDKIQAQLDENSRYLHFNATRCLLAGTAQSGRTSLLFHYAYTYANQNRPVLFICAKEKIFQTLPIFPEGMTPNDDILKNIYLKYIDTDDALRFFLANIHLLSPTPELIIVDDFSSFFIQRGSGQDRNAQFIKTLAFLQDTTDFCTNLLKKNDKDQTCDLIISELVMQHISESGENIMVPKFLYQYEKWIPLILSIEGSNPNFSLGAFQIYKNEDPFHTRLVYSINSGSIYLHKFNTKISQMEKMLAEL